jgi:hypothetical protein
MIRAAVFPNTRCIEGVLYSYFLLKSYQYERTQEYLSKCKYIVSFLMTVVLKHTLTLVL